MEEISIKKAASINAISKYSVVFMNIFFSAILARMLSPEDYGVVAVVTIFTILFTQLADMGFGSAVIQYRELNKADFCHIYTFTFYLGIFLSIIFVLVGIFITNYFDRIVYFKLCILLSISVFFNTLNMIPNAILLRDKKFLYVGIRNILVNIIGYVVAIFLAFAGWKYYSLIFQSIVVAIFNFTLNSYTVKLRIRRKIKWSVIKHIWKYSIFQFFFNTVNYLETNLDNILISICMGSIPLAYYDRAYKLISYPTNNFSSIITPVLHPLLKDYQKDKEYLLNKYIKVQEILSIIAIFVFPICYCASRELIFIFYGNQWESAIFAFQMLSICIYPKIMMGTTGALYCSIGNTKLLFIAGLINAIVTGTCIVIGISMGSIESVALCVSIANWINAIVTFSILIGKGFKKSRIKFLKKFLKDIISMTIMVLVIICVSNVLPYSNIFLLLIIKLLILVLLYCVYLCISNKYLIFINLISKKNKNLTFH